MQSDAIAQINKNVESITIVTEHNSTGTQQIAVSAGELEGLTANLQILLQKFDLRTETDGRQINRRFSSTEQSERDHYALLQTTD